MSSIVECPHCGGQLNYDHRYAGFLVECPHCDNELEMPEAYTAAADGEQFGGQYLGKARAELQRGTGWWPLQPKPCSLEPPWEPYDRDSLTRWDFTMNGDWDDPSAGQPHLIPEIKPTNVRDLRAIVIDGFPDDKSTIARAEKLFLSFRSLTHPVSFEVVGRGPWPIIDMKKAERLSEAGGSMEQAFAGYEEPYTVVQFVVHHLDAVECCRLIREHYPRSSLVVENCDNSTTLELGHHASLVGGGKIDLKQSSASMEDCFASTLGLRGMHCFPLRVFGSNEPDPLGKAFAAMEELKRAKWAILQIVFQPARQLWQQNCRDSIVHPFQSGQFLFEQKGINAIREKFNCQLFSVSARLLTSVSKDFDGLKEWCSQFVNPPTEVLQRTVTSEAELRGMGTEFFKPPAQALVATMNGIDNAETLSHERFYQRIALLGRCAFRPGILLNVKELATLAHLPGPSVVASSARLRRRKTDRANELRTAAGRQLPASPPAAEQSQKQVEFINFACDCGKRLRAKREQAGKKVRCPTCESVVLVPVR